MFFQQHSFYDVSCKMSVILPHKQVEICCTLDHFYISRPIYRDIAYSSATMTKVKQRSDFELTGELWRITCKYRGKKGNARYRERPVSISINPGKELSISNNGSSVILSTPLYFAWSCPLTLQHYEVFFFDLHIPMLGSQRINTSWV